ncbi:MAG: hypothetical protein HY951_00935 [Bacteroidia bacterium]|nr:hypothetical protein [Bacteroidia bacterium]
MKKNIINNESDLSKKDFKKFFEDKMNEEEKTRFISNSENDAFEKDALEGYKLFPGAISDVPNIDNTIKTNFSNKLSPVKKVIYFSASIIIISVISIIYFTNSINNNYHKNVITENNFKTISIDTHKINILNKEIKNAVVNSETEQINLGQAKTDQKSVTDFEKTRPLETINKLNPSSVKSININDSSTNESFTAFIYMTTDYMYEFKVIDYSKVYNNNIKTDIFETGSIAAKFENKQNSSADNSANEQSHYVKYKDFLYEAMGKISTNNYKSALQDYIIIIQHFPLDQNANFYGGLCYYNIGLYDKAIEFFNVILESNVAIFYQEAKWYKANSLVSSDKINEAKKEFNEIIKSNGFYKERAIEKLLQLNK